MAQHPFLENLLNGQAVEWKPLGEVFDTITDFTAAGSFASNAKNVQYLQNTGFAQLIRTTDLKSKFSNNSNFIYTDKQGFDYLWRVNLNQESIILPNVGNCGEVYYINPNDLPHDNNVLAPNALLLRATGQNNCFFFHLFQCNEFQQNLYKITSNTGQTKFNKTNLKKIKIPIPPLSVQTKIVQILDVFTAIIAELTTELNMRNRQYQYYRDKLLTHDLEAVQSLATASDSERQRATAGQWCGRLWVMFLIFLRVVMFLKKHCQKLGQMSLISQFYQMVSEPNQYMVGQIKLKFINQA